MVLTGLTDLTSGSDPKPLDGREGSKKPTSATDAAKEGTQPSGAGDGPRMGSQGSMLCELLPIPLRFQAAM